MNKYFDTTTIIIIIITLVLFIAALFTKGFSHDLFLEAGVFLVSVKLILMSYNNSVMNQKMFEELEKIKSKLAERKP